MNKFGFNDSDWEAAKTEAKEILGKRASARIKQTITYSELVSQIHSIRLEANDDPLAELLGEISIEEDALGRGMLSVIVVHKTGDFMPGPGFFELCKRLGRDTADKQKCFIDEFKKVCAYHAAKSSESEVTQAENMIDVISGRRDAYPGFQKDSKKRRAIEIRAMEVAESYYKRKLTGWTIENVSAEKPYDLRCTRKGHNELRVEVKGTQMSFGKIVLTRKEVLNKRSHPNTVLFLVTNIKVVSLESAYEVSGGDELEIDPWVLDEEDLEPLQYSYALPQ